MATKAGEFREVLLAVIDEVKAGTCEPEKAKAIAMIASQVNLSLQIELAAQINQIKWDTGERKQLGHMPLGDETVVSEQ